MLSRSLAIEPYGDQENEGIYVKRGDSARVVRYGELSFDGMTAANVGLYGHGLHLRGYLSMLVGHLEWTRLYEPSSQTLTNLDLYRAQLGVNILHGSKSAELYLMAGALAMHGAYVTPAFDAALEARVYPVRPFTLFAQTGTSVFAHGNPLISARFEPGISIWRIDFRVGAMLMHQAGTFTGIGPSGSVLARW